MRKLLFVGVVIFCANLANAQEDIEVKETILKTDNETYDNIEYLNKNFGDAVIGEIYMIKPDNTIQKAEEPQPEEVPPTPPVPATESAERSSTSRNVTSSGSRSSSSTRKSTSRKRTKRKKISFKRKRKKIKRKPKLGNRAACPRF